MNLSNEVKKIKEWLVQGQGDLVLSSDAVEETLDLAREFGANLKPGTAIGLRGPLGSGKTVFVKGVALGLGLAHEDEVKSPTFVLMHIYEARIPVYHFDLYRLDEAKDLDAIGLEEFLTDPGAVTLVEWSEKSQGRMPAGSFDIEIQTQGEQGRIITIRKIITKS